MRSHGGSRRARSAPLERAPDIRAELRLDTDGVTRTSARGFNSPHLHQYSLHPNEVLRGEHAYRLGPFVLHGMLFPHPDPLEEETGKCATAQRVKPGVELWEVTE